MEVEDLSSTNGTFVNDKRIEKGHLTNGDRLRIGRVELKVERQTLSRRRNLSSRRSAFRGFVLTVP